MEEAALHWDASLFIDHASIQLRLPRLTTATAQTFFHRFFALQSFKKHSSFEVAVTAIFLASKVEESPGLKRSSWLETVIITCYRLWHSHANVSFPCDLRVESKEYEELRQKVLRSERILFHTISFDLRLDHPYKFLIDTVKYIGIQGN